MNARMRLSALLLTVTVASVFFQKSTSAQSGRGFLGGQANAAKPKSSGSNCKKISGNGVQVFDPITGIVSGPVTNAGILDGDLEDVINFAAGFVLTPDPTVVAYTTNLTITTNHGKLKASPVTIQSGVTGSGAEWGHIDSDASTGRFAGATGTISVVFKPVGDPSVGPYEAEITADICFAQ